MALDPNSPHCLCHKPLRDEISPVRVHRVQLLSLKQGQVTKLKQLQHENPLLKVFIALDKISEFRIQLHEF